MNSKDRTYISPHFMLYCFTRNGATVDHDIKNEPSKKDRENLERLATYILEPLWQHFQPLVVARGYMSRQVAYWQGVAPDADYCRGEAVDIVCGDRDRAHFMYTFVRLNCQFCEMRFLPSRDNPRYLHISFCEGKNKCDAQGDVELTYVKLFDVSQTA